MQTTTAMQAPTQAKYQTPLRMDALFKTQPLAKMLSHLRTRRMGLYKIESVHLPNMLVDAATGKVYVAAGQIPDSGFGDVVASVRAVAHLPEWAAHAKELPFMQLLWAAAESATPPHVDCSLRFSIVRMPDVSHTPNYKFTMRLAALCLTRALTVKELMLLAGASAQQVARFLQACDALGCLKAEQVQAAQIEKTQKTSLGLVGRMQAMLMH
jgi:hypothetical protein